MNYGPITITEDSQGKHAIINGEYNGTDPLNVFEDIAVDDIVFNRSFPINTYATIVLPFDINTADTTGIAAVLIYNGIKIVDGERRINMKVIYATPEYAAEHGLSNFDDIELTAYTPYVFIMNNATFGINAPATIKKMKESITSKDGWALRGTLRMHRWTTDDVEMGVAYGFSGSSAESIEVGDFVKIGDGAYIRSLRAYIIKTPLPKKLPTE